MRILSYALIFIGLFIGQSALSEEDAPRHRALLIACDTFLYAAEITPAGRNNLKMMDDILARDTRGFEITHQYGITSSAEALIFAIRAAFAEAREGDISLLYISTHGEFDPTVNNPEGALLLSDGSLEDRITAQELAAALDPIAGTKAVIIDACNSGAFIAKGISPSAGPARVARPFEFGKYKILTSSGASELSWYWRESLDTAPPGSSYFTTALALGAGYLGSFPADANRDGTITLAEMYDYLWINHASSTVQMFPQEDDFPLLMYDRALLADDDTRGELSGFSFGRTALDPKNPVLSFEYTVRKPTRAIYQITPHNEGVWDWRGATLLPELSEFDGDADPMGDVTPGRKSVQYDILDALPRGWEYAMAHIITQGKRGANQEPFVYASRILSARRDSGDPGLSIEATGHWQRKYRTELEIFVAHSFPINLSVHIENEQGETVKRLWVARPTRPQSLLPKGSQLYFSGFLSDGSAILPGKYTVVATARVGGEIFRAEHLIEIE